MATWRSAWARRWRIDATPKGDQRAAVHRREAGLDRLAHRVTAVRAEQSRPELVTVTVDTHVAAPEHPAGFSCSYRYLLYGTGDIVIEVHLLPDAGLPDLPRVGLQLRVPGSFNTFTWYGRGPHETYSDRKESGRVGLYSGTVDEQYVPYVVPQENGNKTDVRWAALTDAAGHGLLAVAQPLLEVSAHHYRTGDPAIAQHTHELVRREEITLNLDHRQSGLGGNSCGPGTLPQYRIPTQETRLSVRLTPLSPANRSAMALSKQRLGRLEFTE